MLKLNGDALLDPGDIVIYAHVRDLGVSAGAMTIVIESDRAASMTARLRVKQSGAISWWPGFALHPPSKRDGRAWRHDVD